MLFQSLCAQALVAFALPSFVLGSAIPRDVSDIDAGVTLATLEPQFFALDTITAREALEEDIDTPHLAARALTADEAESFRIHNAARKEKGLKPLVWDQKLWQDALAYAKVLAKKGRLEHSTNRNGQGENLGFVSSTNTITNPKTIASRGWVNEKKNYNGQVIPQGNFGSYGHYTQVVWKSTTKVGIASAKDGKGGWYTVARYSPPGNYVGQKPF